MGYKTEVHEECIKIIRKFMASLKYDVTGYNNGTEFDPFNKNKNQFAKTVKDCCELGASSIALSIRTLMDIYATEEAVKKNKQAAKTILKKIYFLQKVQKQLYNLWAKKPTYICNYFDKYSKVASEGSIKTFMVHN
tara:strand:+ start:5845 stop:6252 length:408 start_codon:yes stop_codon:yes gene_type:complete